MLYKNTLSIFIFWFSALPIPLSPNLHGNKTRIINFQRDIIDLLMKYKCRGWFNREITVSLEKTENEIKITMQAISKYLQMMDKDDIYKVW